MKFLTQFLLHPTKIGAIAPSSKSLAKLVCDVAELEESKIIVELGPGNGSITEEILNRKPKESRFYCLEINEEFYEELRRKFPSTEIYLDSAENLENYLKENEKASTIISGLPFASFKKDLQTRIITNAYNTLEPKGNFVTFGYPIGTNLPSGKRLKVLLEKTFEEVRKTKIEYKNIPPAFAYCCKK